MKINTLRTIDIEKLASGVSTALIIAVTAVTLSPFAYSAIEPEVAHALSATDEVIVTLTVDAGISITDSANTSMSRNLGVTADTAIATSTWNVKTNNAAGYTLGVRATTTPAMRNATNNILDYTPAVAATPETWTVANGAEFGFSAFGTDVASGTWGATTNCGAAHVPNATLKYRDFDTTDITIGSRASTTTTAGIDSTVCYAVEQDTFYIPSGVYQATIVATATAL
jgi:hypothetical protein